MLLFLFAACSSKLEDTVLLLTFPAYRLAKTVPQNPALLTNAPSMN